jgi:hypothetical protein
LLAALCIEAGRRIRRRRRAPAVPVASGVEQRRTPPPRVPAG